MFKNSFIVCVLMASAMFSCDEDSGESSTAIDTSAFIDSIVEAYDLYVPEDIEGKQEHEIAIIDSLRIYGSDDMYSLIEYSFGHGAGAGVPWKYQVLVDPKGRLIKKMMATRIRFLDIEDGEYPYLLVLESTSKGNGGHLLYRFESDSLKTVMNTLLNDEYRTYDMHQDRSMNDPYELDIVISDYNNDGMNDIAFKGKKVYLQGVTKEGIWYDTRMVAGESMSFTPDDPFKRVDVAYIYLYDPSDGLFKMAVY